MERSFGGDSKNLGGNISKGIVVIYRKFRADLIRCLPRAIKLKPLVAGEIVLGRAGRARQG